MLAALSIDPWHYLHSEDSLEVMVGGAMAEGANKYLNDRDAALAKAIAQEVGKVVGKMMKGRKKG